MEIKMDEMPRAKSKEEIIKAQKNEMMVRSFVSQLESESMTLDSFTKTIKGMMGKVLTREEVALALRDGVRALEKKTLAHPKAILKMYSFMEEGLITEGEFSGYVDLTRDSHAGVNDANIKEMILTIKKDYPNMTGDEKFMAVSLGEMMSLGKNYQSADLERTAAFAGKPEENK
jgi:hypothetical protein